MTLRQASAVDAVPFRSATQIDTAIGIATAILRRHGVLAYPTETVYGFGGAVDREGVDAVFALKGRDPAKRFLLLVDGFPMIANIRLRLDGPARALAERHWPGALTLVLPGEGEGLPEELRGAGGGVAVRWTSHYGVTRLLEAYGGPITSTSANRPGVPPAMSAEEIVSEWGEAISRGALMVLDGGRLEPSAPSTVVDCTGPRPRVIRPGAIPVRVLRDSVPELGDV